MENQAYGLRPSSPLLQVTPELSVLLGTTLHQTRSSHHVFRVPRNCAVWLILGLLAHLE